MIYYAIIIGIAIICVFAAYAYGYQHGWRDSSKVKVLDEFPEELSSHADPTIPRDFPRR